MADPIPVGSVVFYCGSHSPDWDRRYVVTAHEKPREGISDPEVNYPDGVAYTIWPEGMPRKFGLREHMISQVRGQSLELAPLMNEQEAIGELVKLAQTAIAGGGAGVTTRQRQALDLLSERYE